MRERTKINAAPTAAVAEPTIVNVQPAAWLRVVASRQPVCREMQEGWF